MTKIKKIEYYFPENRVFNDSENRTTKKIGISSKYIAAENETALDLAIKAAEKIFKNGIIRKEEIDFLLFCTQSPDYILPTSACIIQEKLGLSTSCGALDFNLGCSGFIYGLSLAKGLIKSNQATNVLLLTADTYSKYINENDLSTSLLFGDGAAATLITKSEDDCIGEFVFGTDGSGAHNLIIYSGAAREPVASNGATKFVDGRGHIRNKSDLYMNGPEVFNFAMREVPESIYSLLEKEHKTINDYDYFVFHQANQYMLNALRKRLEIDINKFSIQMSDCGNTVSATIPIALKREIEAGKIKDGHTILLAGFGVGLSWASCSLKINLN